MPTTGRRLHSERAADEIASRVAAGASGGEDDGGDGEDWEAVAARIDFSRPGEARSGDIRRAIDAIWEDGERERHAAGLIEYGLAAGRKSYDRSLIIAYLRRFPFDHPAFPVLLNAAEESAERHDWIWRERGQRWHFWSDEAGPATLGAALLATDDPASLLREAGLDGELAEGGFVAEALGDACETVGDSMSAEAETLGGRLIRLFDTLGVGSMDAMLVYALLNPWISTQPSEEHSKLVGGLLVKRIGDPRQFDRSAWGAILKQLGELMPGVRPDAMMAVLVGWLTQTTVREFFKIVGRTTDDPVQWGAREKFWLDYLEAGVISKAWFAFGAKAENLVHSLGETSSVGAGKIIGSSQYANPSHSSLILEIGDQIIAEWSHSGSCRFWMAADQDHAPAFYKSTYFGYQLRAMNGGGGFEYIDHKGRWQAKFARRIFDKTGVRHPFHQDGWAA
ncbi:hypothetical protein FHS96_005849 [Sphingomonas zeicaulis]|uniref:EH signature domain-containing protein n=1 Tax=Sphingomonas zeicaulis TaxID=1632740 RepID=UPI003D1BFCB1